MWPAAPARLYEGLKGLEPRSLKANTSANPEAPSHEHPQTGRLPSLPPPRRLACAFSTHHAKPNAQHQITQRLRGFTLTPAAAVTAAGSSPRLLATV